VMTILTQVLIMYNLTALGAFLGVCSRRSIRYPR
jgi:hypothetical protein